MQKRPGYYNTLRQGMTKSKYRRQTKNTFLLSTSFSVDSI